MRTLILFSALSLFCICQMNALDMGKNKQFKTVASDISNDEILEIVGIAKHNGKSVDGLKITIYEEDKIVEEFEFNSKKKLRLFLHKNKYYTVVYHKSGFVPRIIVINTEIPKVHKSDVVYEFEFELNLIPEYHEFDKHYIDFPVAIIQYNSLENHFTNSKLYDDHIKQLTRQSY